MSEENILSKYISENGNFPNNPILPLMVYRNQLEMNDQNPSQTFDEVFKKNKWGNSWRNGIYDYHHYHSTAHEVLGIYSGNAKVEFGGPNGTIVEVQKGDVIIIPAGVAHKNIGSSNDFACLGAYPFGQNYDMNYGKEEERPSTDYKIKSVPLPENDPVFGEKGGIMNFWRP